MTPNQIEQVWRSWNELDMENMSIEEFCRCFPCFCCDDMKSLRGKIVKKLCCIDSDNPVEVVWDCCDPEPDCDCCDEEPPCELENCPEDYVRVRFRIRNDNQTDSTGSYNYVLMFSDIVRRHGGKTCCEDVNPEVQIPETKWLCSFRGSDSYINVCIHPDRIPEMIQESQNNNLTMIGQDDWSDNPISCRCMG